jgi:hypothetical protein
MRMHSVLPWPSIAFGPTKKAEKSRKSKAAEESPRVLAAQRRRVPPPTDDGDARDPPNEKIDIFV